MGARHSFLSTIRRKAHLPNLPEVKTSYSDKIRNADKENVTTSKKWRISTWRLHDKCGQPKTLLQIGRL